ncbi:hypothetical protein PQS31_14140 [Luteimonas sp BLCC-B24]|uniref:GNAT family N-acetyltransferase n=1 Tax=Luteimonas sp. BLCC-B24 TaxID=3025317 RepID=UPI00234D0BEF|nr:hypothetical protein [Luteimonas sp. BLCC-B24]MDC7807950.1 hypothetical protein [Luteimonas sp. BLCC-B24]
MTSCALRQGSGRLDARLTPWDERALGFVTAEVTHFEAELAQDAAALLAGLEQWASALAVRYLFGRVDANDQLLRAALAAGDFRFVETSLTVSRSSAHTLPAVPQGMRPSLRPAVADDIPTLRRIAQDDFHHGRFLEDPAIDTRAARARTANWVEDLVAGGLAYTAESRGRIIGFHAERVHAAERCAELLLTGVAAPYAMLAVPLWVTALEALGARDIQSCTTLVSAANTGILNLYARLGFQFNSSLTGFRKSL